MAHNHGRLTCWQASKRWPGCCSIVTACEHGDFRPKEGDYKAFCLSRGGQEKDPELEGPLAQTYVVDVDKFFSISTSPTGVRRSTI